MKVDFSNSPKLADEEIPDISGFISTQRQFFKTGSTRSYDFRLRQLKILREMVKNHQDEITDAIKKDLGRPYFEAYGVDVGIVLAEVNHAIKHLKKWMKPVKTNPGMVHFKAKVTLEPNPRGVALIVSPWNYPIMLGLLPLIAVLAAGNTAIIKPSELSVNSSKLLDDLIHDYFKTEVVEVILGGPETAQAILKERFDVMMFTGSTRVGKIYAKAAAEHFTPIVLELGGKSPTIVHKSAKLKIAAQRILFGKYVNSAQTCVAPDYLLVDEAVKDEFVEILKETIVEYYGMNPHESDDYARIINNGHFRRISGLLDEVNDQVIFGGETDESDLYISPTLIDSPDLETKVMQEEIFGPLLPIYPFSTLSEIKRIVEQNENPLAIYVFSEDEKFIEDIKEIPSGDLAINDAALHFTVVGQKKGGIGNSGMGGYGGKVGFDAFSHFRTVYRKSTFFNLPFTRPPYTSFKEKLMRFFLK